MTVVLILVALAASLAVALLLAVRGQRLRVSGLDDLEGRTQHLDLAAFRNLTDPGEEEFLRAELSPTLFRKVQRERLRAAADYVRRAAANAAVLLRIGEAAQRDPQPAVAAAGQELVASALRLRLYTMLALGLLYARIVLPGARLSALPVVDRYERLVDGVARLGRLQRPAYAGRLSAQV